MVDGGGQAGLALVLLALMVAPALPAAPALASTEPVRFIAIGDQGAGNADQAKVAAAMQTVCARHGCDFVISLGDNIYEVGVSDPYDPQFETKYENVYAGLGLPWYMSLGNHDVSYDPVLQSEAGHATGPLAEEASSVGAGHWYESGNHQVAYAHRTDRLSDNWNMPARYYTFDAGPAQFFALDTNTLMYFGQPFPPNLDSEILAQEAWIEEELGDSEATWKLSFGHHPYRSNGRHGNAGSYEGAPGTPVAGVYVKEFYERHICGKVDLILAGHDHDLEWLLPVDSCGSTEFIVSGAGSKERALENHGQPGPYFLSEASDAYFSRGEVLGFFWIEIDGATLTGRAFDGDANLLYERIITK